MNKKLLVIGLILMLIGIALSIASSPAFLPSSLVNSSQTTLTIARNTTYTLPLSLTGFEVAISYASSTALAFVVANSSAYNKLSGLSGTALANAAIGLEGKGVAEISIENRSVFPYYPTINTSIVKPPEYSEGSNLTGTYYAMFSPIMGNATVTINEVSLSLSSARMTTGRMSAEIFVSSMLFIAGLLIAIFSLFARKKTSEEAAPDERIEKIYDRIEKKQKRHTKNKE